MLKKIMNKLFLSCLKATELIEKSFHIKLSVSEQMQLKAHKMMCSACKTYEKQSAIIEQGLKMEHKNLPDETEMEQLKKRISVNLNQTEN